MLSLWNWLVTKFGLNNLNYLWPCTVDMYMYISIQPTTECSIHFFVGLPNKSDTCCSLLTWLYWFQFQYWFRTFLSGYFVMIIKIMNDHFTTSIFLSLSRPVCLSLTGNVKCHLVFPFVVFSPTQNKLLLPIWIIVLIHYVLLKRL